jgi:hypothetical protein
VIRKRAITIGAHLLQQWEPKLVIRTLNREWRRDTANGSTLQSNKTIQPKGKHFTEYITCTDDGTCRNTQADIAGEIFAHQAMFPDIEHDYIDPFLAYKAVSDPDTLYYHQAMKEPDREKFELGMEKEIKDQFENGNFTVIRKTEVPEWTHDPPSGVANAKKTRCQNR